MSGAETLTDKRAMVMLEILSEYEGDVPSGTLRAELAARDCPNDHTHISMSAKYLRNAGFNVIAGKGRDAHWRLDPPAEATRAWGIRQLRESYSCTVSAHRSLTRVLAGPASGETALLTQVKMMFVGAAYALGGMSGLDNGRIQTDLEVPITNGT